MGNYQPVKIQRLKKAYSTACPMGLSMDTVFGSRAYTDRRLQSGQKRGRVLPLETWSKIAVLHP